MYPWKLWPLRDDSRSDKEVIRYLQAENAYADATLAHTKPLQEQTYKEIVGRIKQDDSTVPYRKRGYWYYRRYDTGKEYPIYARKLGTPDASEQVMLDANEMARGQGLFQVDGWAVSPDNRLLAWTEDIRKSLRTAAPRRLLARHPMVGLPSCRRRNY